MTLAEKAQELGERLAASDAPEELKTTILDILPKLTEHDLDRILYALRVEEGQRARLEEALEAFVAMQRGGASALREAEQRVVGDVMDDFLTQTVREGMERKIGGASANGTPSS